ncbi:acyltransferase family protein [Mucilaginibacter kameinonensis]|uniref:acyltransferase family protein n=1 Tax=Mucilaginibacter kameinonensis TaxID=452286 RepID=UPI000EF7ECEE|nr:DUF5009 domain-containing protein [Mucilaginibacter kameinonensis]
MNPLKERLQSLDVFRGLTIASMIIVNTPGDHDHAFAPLKHSEWNGCTPTDLVFPCFIFMMGISIVFALQSKKDDLEKRRDIILKALKRMVLLILIGWGIQLVYNFNFSTLRFPGVLPRLGVVYFLSTVIYLYIPQKGWKYIFGGILIGYYIVICLIPLQGSFAVTPTHNIAAVIDRFFLSEKHLAKFAYTDPCGIIGTLPAVCSAMVGLYAGAILKELKLSAKNKFGSLAVMGCLFTIAGLLFNLLFPLNKPLWSSSYVLFAGGICMVAFALCYLLIDIKKIKMPYWIFTVFGINAIASYVLSEVLPEPLGLIHVTTTQGKVSGMHIFNDIVFKSIIGPQWASLITAIVFTLIVWLPMYVFDKKKIIVKI